MQVFTYMAEIEIRKESFSMVKLDIFDRIKIKTVIEEYCGKKGISLKDLAKELNISRAQLYNIFDTRLIDIQALIRLQKKFNFCLLKASEVEKYLSKLEFDLLRINQKQMLNKELDSDRRQTYKSEWLQNCHFLNVNSYYAFLYLRFLSDFLWFDDRKYLSENHEKLPFWKHKYMRDSQSIYRIPEYKNANAIFNKDKEFQTLLDNEEIVYLKNLSESLEEGKSLAIENLQRENDYDWYISRKISEFVETSLISNSGIPNNEFGVKLDFPKELSRIETVKNNINIPIAGTKVNWLRYSGFVKTVIKERDVSNEIKKDHGIYHEDFMKKVFQIIEGDIKNIKTLQSKLLDRSSTSDIRFTNLLPAEIKYYSKDENNKELLIDPLFFKADNLFEEANLLVELKMLLKENNWGFDEDFLGSTIANKVYYCDLIVHENKFGFNDDGDNKVIQITLKIFKKKNTLQISTLERILKTLEKDKWDKHIIISNLPFSEKCIEFVKGTKIYLLLEKDKEKLIEIMSN